MNLIISKITLREILLPLREPFRISSGTVQNRRICLLELESADGATGWSECVAGEFPNYSSETIDTAWLAIKEWLAPRIIGTSLTGPHEVHELLNRDIRGHQMAKAALEMGVWELAAQTKNVALAQLLGGVRATIEVGISLGIQQDPATLVEKVRRSIEQGYRKIKVKIKPGNDIDFLRAVREEFGPEVPLMVDANSAYTLDEADHLKRLDEFHLMMVEQPLAHDDLLRHARLQRMLETPICLDESVTSVEKAEDMVTLGSGRIVNIKPGRVGGFLSSIAIHDFCRNHGIPVWCGGMLESGIGRAHNIALASLPNFTLPGDLSPSARYWEKDIVQPEWTMSSDGMIKVPMDKPGMGVAVDRDRVDNLTVRSETLTRPR